MQNIFLKKENNDDKYLSFSALILIGTAWIFKPNQQKDINFYNSKGHGPIQKGQKRKHIKFY